MKRTKKLNQAAYSNLPVWDRQQAILRQVQKEAEHEHFNDPRPEIPEYKESTEKVSYSVGVYNFIRQVLP